MSILEYLEKHLPSQKAQLILEYIEGYKCILKITKPRKTKRGDFRQKGSKLSISVNHDTNSYRFLFTLVHEIAHLKTFVDYRNKVKPHGPEWKSNFEQLFYYFGMEEEFGRSSDLLNVVKNELINPKACSGVSLNVEKAFAEFDENPIIHLEDIPEGDDFIFRNTRYQKLETRRSRVLCLNRTNQKKYTINKAASVEPCL
ncbi:MAG: SprT-like domain-containing protein [Bacteroidia bacterium]